MTKYSQALEGRHTPINSGIHMACQCEWTCVASPLTAPSDTNSRYLRSSGHFPFLFSSLFGAKSDENRKEILSLRSGEELRYDDHILFNPKTSHAVAQLSQKMRSELQQWEDKGYHVSEASIRFIVAWRPKDAPKGEKEHAIILTDLTMRRA